MVLAYITYYFPHNTKKLSFSLWKLWNNLQKCGLTHLLSALSILTWLYFQVLEAQEHWTLTGCILFRSQRRRRLKRTGPEVRLSPHIMKISLSPAGRTTKPCTCAPTSSGRSPWSRLRGGTGSRESMWTWTSPTASSSTTGEWAEWIWLMPWRLGKSKIQKNYVWCQHRFFSSLDTEVELDPTSGGGVFGTGPWALQPSKPGDWWRLSQRPRCPSLTSSVPSCWRLWKSMGPREWDQVRLSSSAASPGTGRGDTLRVTWLSEEARTGDVSDQGAPVGLGLSVSGAKWVSTRTASSHTTQLRSNSAATILAGGNVDPQSTMEKFCLKWNDF